VCGSRIVLGVGPKHKEDTVLVSTFALVSSSTVTNVRTSCRGASQQEFVKMTRRRDYVTSMWWVIQGRACHQQSMHWKPNNMQGKTQQPRGMKRFSGDKNCRTAWQGTNEQLDRHSGGEGRFNCSFKEEWVDKYKWQIDQKIYLSSSKQWGRATHVSLGTEINGR
jgi:hypothetical protein